MANIHDVAKRADVAISTVSNVISGRKRVSDDVRTRVETAIRELSYEADPIARSMKGSSSRTVGVVITNMSRIFFPPLVRGIQGAADADGYRILTMDTDDRFDRERSFIDHMCRNRFDGIVLDSVAEIDDLDYYAHLAGLTNRGKRIALVSIEKDLSAHGIDSVVPDNYGGAVEAVRHLAGAGCRSVMHITGPVNAPMAEMRLKGFLDAVRDAGMPYHDTRVAFGDFSPQSGYRIVRQYREDGALARYDGIFAANDQMAVGVVKALRETGVRIPEEMKVVGFDDSFVSSLIDPSLTTLHVPSRRIGLEAFESLRHRMRHPDGPATCRTIPLHLVARRSTGTMSDSEWDLMTW